MTLTSRVTIDLERFLRGLVEVRNDAGGRGYDRGVRVFDCPLCGDRKGRGWAHLGSWTYGCFNEGCPASPRLEGGAVEFARRVFGLPTRAEVWRRLEREFGGAAPVEYAPAPRRGPDFCNLPPGMRPFEPSGGSPMQEVFEAFVERQWGLDGRDAREWGLGWCLTGPYAWRVVVPVVMGGQVVGFQARSVRGNAEPKYLTSRSSDDPGRPAECGRPAAAMLFNVDALPPDGEALVVEGAGDAMRWHRGARGRTPTALALLGTAMTPEKLALIAGRRPERAVVALDAEPAARRRALSHVEDLRAWGVPAALGRWSGGKDSGSGASLTEEVSDEGGLGGAVRARLWSGGPPT